MTRSAFAVVLGITLSACADTPATPLRPTDARALQVISGNNQTADIGTTLALPIVAKVVDGTNTPVPGVVVNFRVTKGGGTVYAGSSISNAQGIVKERWSLGWVPQSPQELEVRAVSNTSGDSILYARIAATANIPSGFNKVWLGNQIPAMGPEDWLDDDNWYPAGAPTSSSTVLIPAMAANWPKFDAYELDGFSCPNPSRTVKKLVLRPGSWLYIGTFGQYDPDVGSTSCPLILNVNGPVDAANAEVVGPGRIVQTASSNVRGSFTTFVAGQTSTLNGNVVADHVSGSLVIGAFALTAHVDDCHLTMTDPAGTVNDLHDGLYCDVGSYSAGTIISHSIDGFPKGIVSGSHTAIEDVGSIIYEHIYEDFPISAFQNLRVRGKPTGEAYMYIAQDTLLVKGNLYVDSATLHVDGSLLRVLGNVVVAAGATLHNEGHIQYRGTFTNNGTLIGSAPVHVDH